MCSIEKKDLTLNLPDVIIDEIVSYLNNSSKFYILYHAKPHPICISCRNLLEYRAAICDTNTVKCPHFRCQRMIFVG
jgi:hypothetical protein